MAAITPLSVQTVAATAPATAADSAPRTRAVSPVAATVPVQAAARAPSQSGQRAAAAAAEQIESFLRHVNTNLEFRVDEAAGKVVISVRERATGELIRQIPSEEALAIAASLDEYSVSGLLDRVT